MLSQLSENGFFVAPVEHNVIKSFLALKPGHGIPQGTSLSLFLANLACWRLDRDLLDDGLKFARYADDTVIWSPHYDRICRGAERIAEFSRSTGVAINPYKSSGISLLVKRGFSSEFAKTKDHIEFLGYKLSSDHVSIKTAAVQRIKRNISYTLYHHLIQPLRGDALQAVTIPANDEDRDLVVAISTIRRYLYGNLTEDLLKAYLGGRYDRMTFKGLMSFYPLVTDEEQLRALDGWLISIIFRCVQLRSRLLKKWNQDRSDRFPFNTNRSRFARICRSMRVKDKPLYQIPSFLRIHQAVQKRLLIGGVGETIDPSDDPYQYEAE